MADRQENDVIAITTTAGAGAFVVTDIRGEEKLSYVYRYRLTLFTDQEDLDVSALAGTDASIRIRMADGEDRYISGILARFILKKIDTPGDRVWFEADLVPKLYLLGLQADCRIFQNKTVVEIIETVLGDGGVTDIKKSLTGTYEAREYCVQYRETALNFVHRLMEEEGIFYYFEHTTSTHTIVLADDSSAHQNCPSGHILKYRENIVERSMDELISDIAMEQRVTTGAVGLDDFNFETPSTDLYTKVAGERTETINDFPGRIIDTSGAEKYANLRLQGFELPAKLLYGGGRLRSLVCGGKITLQDHTRSEFNGEYVLMTVRLQATREEYRVKFTAFPSDKIFRPVDTARKPIIPSTQTAFVVGKTGEEIWVDEYGRVKVQFHWDRDGQKDENSSCWIRVAQGWAGKSWGMMFIPRIGQEVVVSFLDGDPDRPLITGSVYNSEQTVPYTLPDEQTKSTIKSQSSKNGTGKFNELRFEDKLDAEEIYLHGQKDMVILIENDVTRDIKHDEKETIENDKTLTVNHDHTITVKNNRTLTVSEGNDVYKVEKGTRAVSVKGDETHTNEAKFTHEVKGDYALTVKGKMDVEVTGALTIKAASIKIETASGDFEIKSAMAVKSKSGTDTKIESGTNAEVKGGINLDLKAAANWTGEGGAMMSLKGSAMGTVDGGGMLTVKGGLVKIN